MSQVVKVSFAREEPTANGVPKTHAGSKSHPNSSSGGKKSGRGGKPFPTSTFLCSLETGDDCKLSVYDELSPNKTRFKKDGSRKQILLELSDLFKKAAETTVDEERGADDLSETEGQQEESSDGGVSFITVYPGMDMSVAYVDVTPRDLSTLIVTRKGEVFGKGRNSLHCCPFMPSMIPMKEDGEVFLEDFVKIDMLQGLKIKKIATDEFFGAALTADKELYKWGCYKRAPEDVVVRLEEYRPGPCHCGETSGGKRRREGSADLMYCTHGKSDYKAYTASGLPPSGVPVRKFILHDRANISCPKCHKLSTPTPISYDGYRLSHCAKCKRLFEAEDTEDVYVKIPLKIKSGVVDMDCTEELMWTLSEGSSLSVTKYDLTQSSVIPLQLPSGEVLRTVNCGRRHVAVVTNRGNVYCYGNRGHENPKNRSREGRLNAITLWKADVPGRVQKVNCGKFSTICLLDDGSVCIIEKDGVVSKVGSEYAFPTVSARPLLDIVYKLKYPFYGKRGKEVMKNLNEFEEVVASLTMILAGTNLEDGTPWEPLARSEPQPQQQR